MFQTRWAMSYLRGPLTRDQIKTLMDPMRSQFASRVERGGARRARRRGRARHGGEQSADSAGRHPRSVSPGCRPRARRLLGLNTAPALLGSGKVHFTRASDDIDVWRECHLLQPLRDTPPDDIWDKATMFPERLATRTKPDAGGCVRRSAVGTGPRKELRDFRPAVGGAPVSRDRRSKLWQCELVDRCSRSRANQESEFRKRLEPLGQRAADAERAAHRATVAAEARRMSRVESNRPRPASAPRNGSSGLASRASSGCIVETVSATQRHGPPGRPRSPKWRCAAWPPNAASRSPLRPVSTSYSKKRNCWKRSATRRSPIWTENTSPIDCRWKRLVLKPRKTDIEIDRVSLVWLPYPRRRARCGRGRL